MSLTLFNLTARHEGLKRTAYQDGVGVWTICRGHTRGVHRGMTATVEQCDRWFREDLAIAEAGVKRHLKAPVSRNQFDAYADFVFNAGETNFAKSSMLRKANAGDVAGSCRAFFLWYKAGPLDCRTDRRCSGVWRRRNDEFQLCMTYTTERVNP